MDILPRFFLKTVDGLFFAVNTYFHPETHYVAFLRYVPSSDGDRELDGMKYSKVNSQEAYDFIREVHPDYLFDWNVEGKKMMGVLKEDVVEVLSPVEKLKEIINSEDDNVMYHKIRLLSSIMHDEGGISYDDMGVTGSTLAGLDKCNTSDIDFVIFGLENHRKAVELYSILKNDESNPLDKISGDYWGPVFENRVKDDSMTLDEFVWYESRKNNRGLIMGTTFALLLTRKSDEVMDDASASFKPLEKMRIKCEIIDDSESYDIPSTYYVDNVEILEGPPVNIEKIISFTHTFTAIAKNNEEVIASGVCEEVRKKDCEKSYNLVVGTTRESINEYIKLAENPLNKIK
ncbi:MAG: hypothetical protein BZ138_03725 [Methanosphaera sp. rholeuAM270]|nr:MAG: hypothetical protein BZ138_03725 [Methanosphaera sp. rholeuAM270]